MKKKSLIKGLLYAALLYLGYQGIQYAVAYAIQLGGYLSGMDEATVTAFYYAHVYHANILGALIYLGIVMLALRERLPARTGMKPIRALPAAAAGFFGVGSYAICFGVVSIATRIPSVAESMEKYTQEMDTFSQMSPSPFWEIFAVIVMAPVVEEIIFRGMILTRLKESVHPYLAVLLTALGFAVFHGNLYQAVYTFVFGGLAGYFTVRFSSLWYGVLMHFCLNGFNVLLQLPRMFPNFLPQHWQGAFTLCLLLFSVFALAMGDLLLKQARGDARTLRERLVFYQNEPAKEETYTTEKEVDMAAPEMIIVGLGNPGEKYAVTRHNCGFAAVDYIALREKAEFRNLRFRSYVAEVVLEGKKCLLLKPQTFMNLSGEAVREAAAFYKIPPEKILVIFDDINFEPGVFRIRRNGSAGGHNGIKSIISCLGSDAFCRIKLGVGAPPEGRDLMHHVLGAFPSEDREKFLHSLEDVYRSAKCIVDGRTDEAMNLYSGKKHE